MGSTAVANPPYSRLRPQRGDCQVHSPDKRKREAAGHGRNHVHFTKRCQARLRIVKNLVLFDCRAARSTGVFIVSIGRTSTATARRASCLHPTRPRPRMRRPDTFEDDIKTVRARLSKDPAPRFGRRKRSRRRVGAEECRSRCEGGIGGMRCSVWWEIFFLGGGRTWNILERVSAKGVSSPAAQQNLTFDGPNHADRGSDGPTRNVPTSACSSRSWIGGSS